MYDAGDVEVLVRVNWRLHGFSTNVMPDAVDKWSSFNFGKIITHELLINNWQDNIRDHVYSRFIMHFIGNLM